MVNGIRIICLFLLFELCLLSYSNKSYAIPVFARKYNVSCMQCHVAIFRRNEFGDAFRRNGYQWPGGKDEKSTVEKSIPLKGNAIGVGAIPKSVPIAFYGHQRVKYDTSSSKKDKAEFDPHELELLTGGTLGKDISFFGEWLVWQKGKTDADRIGELWFMLDNLFESGLNFKIGRMTQSLSLYKENDRLTLNHIIINDSKVKNFKLSGKRHGIEFNGIIADRFDYAFGIGDNNNNWTDENYKDFYYHVGARPSGMTFTGIDPDMDFNNPSVFDYLTLTFSHFGYFGTESVFDSNGDMDYTNQISRFGFDLEARYKNLTFQNGIVIGRDDNPSGNNESVDSTSFFSELDYRFTSWLILAYRFEHFDNDLSSSSLIKQHNPALIYLLRENIRVSLEALFKDDSEDNETYTFNILYAF